MDEQYIDAEEQEKSAPYKQNRHLTLVLATVIVLILATVFVTLIKQGDSTPEPEVTPAMPETSPAVDESTSEAEALEAFNAFQAAQATNTPPSLPPTPEANTPGLVSCFDYYTFGSVQVQLGPYQSSYSAADPILLGGDIINENPYPVVNGQIYMKVFKLEQESEEATRENGYPMIDFVLVEDGINIGAYGTTSLQYEWNLPYNASKGDYQVAFYFTTEYRYNLMGLSFTDDVTGNTSNFTVSEDRAYNPVVFNKNKVKLNDTDFSFALPPRHFAKEERVVAYSTLVNDSDELRAVELTWTYFRWDGILEENKVSTETQTVVLQPNSEVEVANETPTLDTAVTFLQLEAKDSDAKSVQHIRYVRDGVGETRINYPSLLSYPLKAGEETTIFSCVHSTNEPVVSDGTLELTLKDDKGNKVHSYTYEGDITGAMMGVADTFTPKKDLANLTLTAKLTHKGKTVEEVDIKYNCADIDPELCSDEPEDITPVNPTTDDTQDPTIIIVTTILLLLLIGGGYFLTRKKEDPDQPEAEVTTDNQ